MDKNLFYSKLHKELAKNFFTTSSVIRYIRQSIIALKLNQQQMISVCLRKKRLATSKDHIKKWNDRLNFLLQTDTVTLNKIISRSSATT